MCYADFPNCSPEIQRTTGLGPHTAMRGWRDGCSLKAVCFLQRTPRRQKLAGRPQKYCSDRCRQAHRKIGVRTGIGLRYRIDRVKPKAASQSPDSLDEFEPQNLSQKTQLQFGWLNE